MDVMVNQHCMQQQTHKHKNSRNINRIQKILQEITFKLYYLSIERIKTGVGSANPVLYFRPKPSDLDKANCSWRRSCDNIITILKDAKEL